MGVLYYVLACSYLLLIFRDSPDFRLSLGLCENERIFRKKRKPRTMVALQKFLGDDEGPNTLDEVRYNITNRVFSKILNAWRIVDYCFSNRHQQSH